MPKITKQRSWGHPVAEVRERACHPLSRSVDAVPPPLHAQQSRGGYYDEKQRFEDKHTSRLDEKQKSRFEDKKRFDNLPRDIDRMSYRCVDETQSPTLKSPKPQIISVEIHQDPPHLPHSHHNSNNKLYTSGKSLPVRPDSAATRRASYSSACRREPTSFNRHVHIKH